MMPLDLGQDEEPERLLDRATLLGITSKMYDPQSLVLLAFARLRLRDAKGLQRCRENLEHLATRDGAGERLARFVRTVRVLEHLLGKRLAAAVAQLGALADERMRPELDVEAACNLLSLLSTLSANELQLEGMDAWVQELVLRFATSRSVTGLATQPLQDFRRTPWWGKVQSARQR